MKSFSVKQIAGMLDTNEETVRRWIRDKKLKASKDSNREGNVVTQAQLEAFLKTAPKYLPKFLAGITALSPLAGVVLAASSGIASVALAKYFKDKKTSNVHVDADDFKAYLHDQISQEEGEIERKKEMIQQIQSEITEMSIQIEKYRYLLSDDQLIEETLSLVE